MILKMKQLKCPLCGARLIDSAENCVSELRADGKEEPGWIPDYKQKCPKCKQVIAIKKKAS